MAINAASHWRPTAANYFDRVSKQTLLAHVNEVGGPTMAASFMGSKKGDLSASCETAVRGRDHRRARGQGSRARLGSRTMRFRVLAAERG